MRDISMKARLWSLVALACFGVCALAGLAFTSHHINQGALTTLYERDVNALVQFQRIENQLSDVRFRAAGVLLEQMPVQGSLNHLREVRKALDGQWQAINSKPAERVVDEGSRAALDQAIKGWPLVDKTLGKLEKALVAKDNTALAQALEEDWPLMHKGFVKPIQALIPQTQQAAEQGYARAIQDSQSALLMGLVAAGVCLAGLTVVAWFTIASLLKPLQRLEVSIRRMAEGDLVSELPESRRDEMGHMIAALADMQGKLRALVSEVRRSTESIQTASAEVAAGSLNLSHRTETTAANLQKTASSVGQLSGAVAQSAGAADEANKLSLSAAAVAEQGGQAVAKVVDTMNDISASSKRISDIIGVIDGIAFQTNILALNAAVEAARAGEQGRGFAVVASEVRGLAHRSAAAAKEIKTLIVDSVEKVTSGTHLVSDAGSTMTAIESSVQRVTEIIGRISHSTAEQSSGIHHVNSAVVDLDNLTQQNAALVEQSAAAAESLKEQARRLSQLVATFQLDANAAQQAPLGAA